MEGKYKTTSDYIHNYLERTFVVRDNNVYSISTGRKRWACDTINEVVNVFGFKRGEICDIIEIWVISQGVDWDKWNTLRKIHATWSPEMAQDIAAYTNIDAEAELTAILAAEISVQIDRAVLDGVRNFIELEDRMKEAGYDKKVICDPNNFTPKYQFVPSEND
jgi:hypothetical protein